MRKIVQCMFSIESVQNIRKYFMVIFTININSKISFASLKIELYCNNYLGSQRHFYKTSVQLTCTLYFIAAFTSFVILLMNHS